MTTVRGKGRAKAANQNQISKDQSPTKIPAALRPESIVALSIPGRIPAGSKAALQARCRLSAMPVPSGDVARATEPFRLLIPSPERARFNALSDGIAADS